jgi:hypothetical protein
MIDTVRTIDEIFIAMADAGAGVTIDDAVEELWAALERGELRLVPDGKRLRWAAGSEAAACMTMTTRRTARRRKRGTGEQSGPCSVPRVDGAIP